MMFIIKVALIGVVYPTCSNKSDSDQFDNQNLEDKNMARKRVFISFDVDHDIGTKEMLAGQAKCEDSPFDFIDASVKEPLTGDWVQKVERRMDNVDLVIVLCGEHMYSAQGVAKELSIAQEKKIPYFLLKAYPDKNCTKPTTVKKDDKVYNWNWKNLESLINGAR